MWVRINPNGEIAVHAARLRSARPFRDRLNARFDRGKSCLSLLRRQSGNRRSLTDLGRIQR
jgi:hypothetical protein